MRVINRLDVPAPMSELHRYARLLSTAIETGENVEEIAKDPRKFLDSGAPLPTPARR